MRDELLGIAEQVGLTVEAIEECPMMRIDGGHYEYT